MTDKEHEKKLDDIIEGNYRKKGEPIDINRLVEIAKELDEIETEDEKENSKELAPLHGNS